MGIESTTSIFQWPHKASSSYESLRPCPPSDLPFLLLLKWGRAREVSAIAALFILVNSISGLLGHLSSLQSIPHYAPLLALAALVGGSIGAFFGSRRLPVMAVLRSLSVVLVIAGFKLLLV